MNPFSYTKNPEIILSEVFEDWLDNVGIFELMSDMPWGTDQTIPPILNMEYFGNHSGAKFISPIVMKLLSDDGTITTANRQKLANLIMNKFKIPWTRLWETYDVEYEPLNNYDIMEEIDREITDTGTDTMTYDTSEVTDSDSTDTGTDEMAYGKTSTTTHGKTTVTKDYVAGFNSVSDPPPLTDRTDTTESGTTPVATTGKDTETRDLAKTEDITKTKTGTEEQEKDLSKVEDATIHRYGKIGVTTTQYMIKEERALWLWNFFNQVYSDVDTVLTIAYQDPCAILVN